MNILLQDGQTVLFQGDSITDCGRSRNNDDSLGDGYVNVAAAMFAAICPERKVKFINRGISGDRTGDLKVRWQADCLDLKPDWVSIMIGANDTWRAFDHDDPTSVTDFEANYRDILTRTRDVLGAKLIMMEQFVLPHPADRKAWRADMDPKIHITRSLAREFGAIYIPTDGLFAAACAHREPAFWAHDGVHPSPAGHALIAKAWLEAVGAM